MVFLGFGKYVRSDRIYAVEPIIDERQLRRPPLAVSVGGIPKAIHSLRTSRRVPARARATPQDGDFF